jgi:hypothetical protein
MERRKAPLVAAVGSCRVCIECTVPLSVGLQLVGGSITITVQKVVQLLL